MRLKRNIMCSFVLLLLLTFTGNAALASVERSGSWYDPTHNGEGFIVQFINDDSAVVFWFTYDETGAQRWFTGLGDMTGDRLHIAELLITDGGVFGPEFDPGNIVRTSVGELTLTFSSDSVGLAEYTINEVDGTQNLSRLTRPVEVAGSTDPNIPPKSGSWYDPTRDGEGFVLEVLPDGRQVAYWFTYDLSGRQAWMLALSDGSVAQGSTVLDLLQPVGGRFGPDFNPDDVVREPVGTARLGLQCTGGYGDFSSTDPVDFVDLSFNLQRIVGIGPGACSDPALTTLFPMIDGEVAVPDHQAGRQLSWLFEQTAATEEFSDAVIMERFSAPWLAQNGIGTARDILEEARSLYPNARLTDPVSMAPISMTGLLTASSGREAFYILETDLAEGKITRLALFNYGFGGGGVVSAGDVGLNLEQSADRFATLATQTSLLVARIDEANQCQPVLARDADTLRSTASIFKLWILAGVADALDEKALFHDQIVPLDASKQVQGGLLFSQPAGYEMSIDELSTLMMGISDNTATDMLHELAGRERIDGLHAEYGHQTPSVMAPQLNISEQFHLFFSFSQADAMSYVNGSEPFQQTFLEDRIVPLGSAATGGGGFFNEQLFIDGAWQASPMDICGAFARHRLHTPGSDAALLVERALQMQAAQPNVREYWDRVWYKGGSLESGANGLLVLTHAFMLEREGEQPIAVIAMANNPAGNIDVFDVQSVVGRILSLAVDL